jgi:DNA-binding NarL/FixJ family response regulator
MLELSPREKEILQLYETGLEQKEIATRLGLSPHTVHTHARRIIAKTLATSLRNAAWLRRTAPTPCPNVHASTGVS